MGNLPILKPREVVALLESLGFTEVRQRGSHKQFRHSDGRVYYSAIPCRARCVTDFASTNCERCWFNGWRTS